VLIVELLNSGIEAVVDRIGLERHELSRLAKDTGSAAVFVALLNAVLVWLVILFAR
jgi:diacylglycerol kinase (ATP)